MQKLELKASHRLAKADSTSGDLASYQAAKVIKQKLQNVQQFNTAESSQNYPQQVSVTNNTSMGVDFNGGGHNGGNITGNGPNNFSHSNSNQEATGFGDEDNSLQTDGILAYQLPDKDNKNSSINPLKKK